LVEVHTQPHPDNLLYLPQSVVRGQYIVIHEDDTVTPLHRNLFYIHIRIDIPFFLGYYAPLAPVRASPCQKAVSRSFVYSIQAVIRYGSVYLWR